MLPGDEDTPEKRSDGGQFPRRDDIFGDDLLVGATLLAGVALVAVSYPDAGPTRVGLFMIIAGVLGLLVEGL